VATPRTIVIVGASLAGLRAAETLRREGYDDRVVLVGAEQHLPYDRPPLSKELLAGEWEPEQIALRKQPYDDLGLDLQLGRRATGLDVSGRFVELDGGETLPFDGLVVATGAELDVGPGCRIAGHELVTTRLRHPHMLRRGLLDPNKGLESPLGDRLMQQGAAR